VSGAQLRALGLGRGAAAWRIRRGRLHPVHRGVYAVGHVRLSFRGRLWAAVLACGGPGAAVVSHRSDAAVWELLPSPEGPVDVTTLRRSASTPRIRVHRSRTLDALHDVVHRDGLPVTSPMRTLLDLADALSPHRLERVCHRAEHLRMLDAAALLTPSPGRRSVALTNAIEGLAERGPDITRRELEERFLALTAEHGLPRPLVNVRVCGYEVDFLWPAERLVVETDGRATHLTPTAFESDRRRDALLQVAGYRVVRFTYAQVAWEWRSVVDVIRALV
jgi:hypothetical protein